MSKQCECHDCKVMKPIFEKIRACLTNEENDEFSSLLDTAMMDATDAVYWKDKFHGTWPSDDEKSILRHIAILEKRVNELQTEHIANETYITGYPTEKIGGGNPYSRCVMI